MTPLSALPIAAAALSLPLAWRTPAHRPLAFALVAAQALEAARPALPPALAWGALLALPALSAWAVRVTLWIPQRFYQFYTMAPVGSWLALWGASVLAPWPGWWPVALLAAVIAQGAAWWRWRSNQRIYEDAVRHAGWEPTPPSASELAALVLAAGDAGALLVGLAFGWSAVGWWAAAVAVVLVGVQARAIWRAGQ